MAVNSKKLKVADFFCGGGGFSEGFRQAGFDICFALDKWQPAIDTFTANKPKAKVIKADIIKISNLPDDEFEKLIPDVEIIIGSPPCVAFSNSNNSGNGDKELGIKLLNAYLKVVARKKFKKNSILRYWVLENVPNIEKFIKEEYTANELGLQGEWKLKVKCSTSGIYNAKYYGAPTNRKRYLCGEFPAIKKTHSDNEILPLGSVLNSLGDPTDRTERVITDCNYPSFHMQASQITDHFYEHIVQDFEWENAKRAKQDKGYMGKMSFPENLDKPARTVMATISSCSRESMILARKNNGYRLPTIREVACMMSFPLDYRFYGANESAKYRLVGNAVPPKLSFAIAKAILVDLGENVPIRYKKIKHNPTKYFIDLNNTDIPQKLEQQKRDTSKFKYHVPYLIYSAYRVELTNHHSDFKNKKFKWDVEIHHSQGKKKAAKFTPRLTINHLDDGQKENIEKFIETTSKKLSSYDAFQKVFCKTKLVRKGLIGPYELLSEIREFIDKLFVDEKLKAQLIETTVKPDRLPNAILVSYYILIKLIKNMEDKK